MNFARLLSVCSLLGILFSLTGCTPPQERVAEVDGEIIGKDDFLLQLSSVPSPLGPPIGGLVLSQLINQRLLVIEAREKKVYPTEAEAQEYYQYLKEEHPEVLAQYAGWSDEQILRLVIKPELCSRSLVRLRAGLPGRANVSSNSLPKEVIDYFNRNKDRFRIPERVLAQFVAVPDKTQVDEILRLIKAGTQFASAARTVTNQEVARGKVTRNQPGLPPEFLKVLFETPEEQVTSPVQRGGREWWLGYVEKKEPAREARLDNSGTLHNVLDMLAAEKLQREGLTPRQYLQTLTRQLYQKYRDQINVVMPPLKGVEQLAPNVPSF